MIGRNLELSSLSEADMLVFASHPDDEVIGISTIIRRNKLNGNRVMVIYITDGTGVDGPSWAREKKISEHIARKRYQEGVRGLELLEIKKQNVICLGFPDGGTYRYLKEMSNDVLKIIKHVKPREIYVHCIEGGHTDHDMTSLVIKSVCNKLNFQNVFEWAEYNSLYSLESNNTSFLPKMPFHQEEEIKIELSYYDRMLKRYMLTCHESQKVSKLYNKEEIYRKANIIFIEEELAEYTEVRKKDWAVLVEKFLLYNKRNRLYSNSLEWITTK